MSQAAAQWTNTKLSAEWLADQINDVQCVPELGIGNPVSAMVGRDDVLKQIRHALKASGLDNFTHESWCGTLILSAKTAKPGNLVLIAPVEHKLENIWDLFRLSRVMQPGEIRENQDGRVKVIRLGY